MNLETGEALQVFPEGEEPDMQAIIDAQKDASYYGDVTSTERYVYLASSRGAAHTELEKKGTAIEVYDWEGRAVGRFLVSDVINYMAVDKHGEKLYAVLPDGGMKLYTLPL